MSMPLSVVGQVVPPPIPPPPPPGLAIDQGVYFFLAVGIIFGVVVIKKKQ